MNKNDGKEFENASELRTIANQNQCQKAGAAAFSGKLNHTNSRYYVFNDYYNISC